MAAGLGFKTFTTGEVLTAADTNGYLMQGVLVFASAAARDAAITSPQEGQFAYLKDTNVTTYYTGSAWTNLDTTGMVNPMTTTGDTIYSSSGSTPARLGIGSTGQVMTVAAGLPSWATPAAASSGMTLIKRATTTGAVNTGTTFDSVFTSTYKTYIVNIEAWTAATVVDDPKWQFRYGGVTQASNYYGVTQRIERSSTITYSTNVGVPAAVMGNNQVFPAAYTMTIQDVGNSSQNSRAYFQGTGSVNQPYLSGSIFQDTARVYDGFILSAASNITVTAAVYGLAI